MSKTLHHLLDAREAEVDAALDALRPQVMALEEEKRAIRVAREAIATSVKSLPAKGHGASADSVNYYGGHAPASPFASLTMKQLVRKALDEHFHDGATARQLLDLFHNQWGRTDIIRSSLSPQLTRLSKDDVVWREGLVWRLGRGPMTNAEVRRAIDLGLEESPTPSAQEAFGGPAPAPPPGAWLPPPKSDDIEDLL